MNRLWEHFTFLQCSRPLNHQGLLLYHLLALWMWYTCSRPLSHQGLLLYHLLALWMCYTCSRPLSHQGLLLYHLLALWMCYTCSRPLSHQGPLLYHLLALLTQCGLRNQGLIQRSSFRRRTWGWLPSISRSLSNVLLLIFIVWNYLVLHL